MFELLIQTAPRYADFASREAVQAVGKELVQREEQRKEVTELILDRIANEVSRIAKRPKYVSFLFLLYGVDHLPQLACLDLPLLITVLVL